MIAPSARKSNDCNTLALPGAGKLQLRFCRRDTGNSCDGFLREVLARHKATAGAHLENTRGHHGKPCLVSPDLPLGFSPSDNSEPTIEAA